MTHRIASVALLTVGLLAVGCESTPPTEPDTADLAPQETVLSTARRSAAKTPIAGVIELVDFYLDEMDCRELSSGVFQCRGGYVESAFSGDLEGIVTWTYHTDKGKWLSGPEWFHETAGGTVGGEITWNSRSGMIEGRWSTECKVGRYDCSGTVMAHGSGDLDGVKFQLDWQGLWPFDYEGFALDPHGG